MDNNKKENIGVITEQGFVAGYGLGFNTLNEQDQKKIQQKDNKDNNDKNKK